MLGDVSAPVLPAPVLPAIELTLITAPPTRAVHPSHPRLFQAQIQVWIIFRLIPLILWSVIFSLTTLANRSLLFKKEPQVREEFNRGLRDPFLSPGVGPFVSSKSLWITLESSTIRLSLTRSMLSSVYNQYAAYTTSVQQSEELEERQEP